MTFGAHPRTHKQTHLDELLVVLLVAVVSEDASDGLPLVQGLCGLPQATGKAVSCQGLLEDLLDGLLEVHGGCGCGDSSGGGHGGIIYFDVRHVVK